MESHQKTTRRWKSRTSRQVSQQNVSHANRGKEFEHRLEAVHTVYQKLGLGRIDKNPEVWTFCRAADYDRLPGHMTARTKSGSYLVRKASDIDFSGCYGKLHCEFDCKEFHGSSIPLANFKEHQVEKLITSEKAGSLSGFMVHLADYQKVYWVESSVIRAAQGLIRFQKGRGKYPKSLNLDWFKANGLLITDKPNGMVDWAKILLPSNV